jgi:hypothetical protein
VDGNADFIGSFDFGYVEPTPPVIDLGFAAAASAAMSAFFPPASLLTVGLGLRNAPPLLTLVDGGVYDSLGLEWFQGWGSGRPSSAEPADFLIVANAGGLLSRRTHPYGGLRGLWRAKDVQYSRTTKLRVRWWVGELLAGRARGAYLAVELDPRDYRLPTARRSTRPCTKARFRVASSLRSLAYVQISTGSRPRRRISFRTTPTGLRTLAWAPSTRIWS